MPAIKNVWYQTCLKFNNLPVIIHPFAIIGKKDPLLQRQRDLSKTDLSKAMGLRAKLTPQTADSHFLLAAKRLLHFSLDYKKAYLVVYQVLRLYLPSVYT